MNRLWETDGLARNTYEIQGRKEVRLDVLESEATVLLGRVLEVGEKIPFEEGDSRASGSWGDVWRWEPSVVLAEIRMLDIAKLEREFAKADAAGMKKSRELLSGKLKEWRERAGWKGVERLTAGLQETGEESPDEKAKFYAMLGSIRRIQSNYEIYLGEIEARGQTDPALALLSVFVRNFGKITARFNERWKELEQFYLEHILHLCPRGKEAERLWLSLGRRAESGMTVVEKGTAFTADDGSVFRTTEECCVGDIRPVRILSLWLESDPEWCPAADLGFVTAIWRKEIRLEGKEREARLFGGKDAVFASVGLMLESPMLLLEEGARELSVSFYPTEDALAYLQELEEKCGGNRLFEDAFYLEISTEEGWVRVKDFVLNFRERQYLEFAFRLTEEFGAVVPCEYESHDTSTRMPALRILLNREAWLFPYSWAKKVRFGKMKVGVKVSGIRNVKVYNELGGLDIKTPFYALGVQPEKGAWMVFGNYEMALKPLVRAGLGWRWIGLPRNVGGMEVHYAAYGGRIGNESFRVRTEWLSNGRWKGGGQGDELLFVSDEEGKIGDTSRIACQPDKKMPVVKGNVQGYEPQRVRGGFIRMVLTAPEMGFGHKLYRQLFAQVMMENSRRKRSLPVPTEPISPQMDALTLDYEAEEEVFFAAGQPSGSTRLYHLPLLGHGHLLPVVINTPLEFVTDSDCPYSLYLEFEKAVGYNRLSFFVDFAPLWKEGVCEDSRTGKVRVRSGKWSIFSGRRWVELAERAVLKDDTDGFMKSGLIEIGLPKVIGEEDLNREGRFLAKVSFQGKEGDFPMIRGIYTHVVEVVEEEGNGKGGSKERKWKPKQNLPGIASVVQASPGVRGRKGESREEMALRVANRIAGRGRLVAAADFEKAVLEYFPSVEKVKCLPATDSKGWGRKGTVTVILMRRQEGGGWPMCTGDLLSEAEKRLQELTTPFLRVDAINPVYEEMTVRCHITLMPGNVAGVVIQRLQARLNACIAPWESKGEMPEFGYSFSLQALRNILLEDEGVAGLSGLSVLHVTSSGERAYELKEYRTGSEGGPVVRASAPWCVAVPAARHLIVSEEGEPGPVGWGELEIGKTLVVGTPDEVC